MRYVEEGYIEKNNSQTTLFDKTGNSIDNEKQYVVSYFA